MWADKADNEASAIRCLSSCTSLEHYPHVSVTTRRGHVELVGRRHGEFFEALGTLGLPDSSIRNDGMSLTSGAMSDKCFHSFHSAVE